MTMMPTTRPFDPAQYLDDDESVAAYMTEALESGDVSFIADALGVIARAKGMRQIASETNLSRESLYRALSSEGNPEFATIVGVMKALGLRLTASPIRGANT
jgi:probable addiction module antidote protein